MRILKNISHRGRKSKEQSVTEEFFSDVIKALGKVKKHQGKVRSAGEIKYLKQELSKIRRLCEENQRELNVWLFLRVSEDTARIAEHRETIKIKKEKKIKNITQGLTGISGSKNSCIMECKVH